MPERAIAAVIDKTTLGYIVSLIIATQADGLLHYTAVCIGVTGALVCLWFNIARARQQRELFKEQYYKTKSAKLDYELKRIEVKRKIDQYCHCNKGD